MSEHYAFVRHNMLNFKKLQEAEVHGRGEDQSSKNRRRADARERCVSITEADGKLRLGGEHFNLRAAYRRHKKETGAREHPRGKPVMHMLVGVSPKWVKEAGNLHDPNNPAQPKAAEGCPSMGRADLRRMLRRSHGHRRNGRRG